MKPLASGIWTDLMAPSRMLSTGRNCAPAAATAVTPTSPHEHGGHEPAPPLVLQAHPCVLPTRWLSSRPQASIA